MPQQADVTVVEIKNLTDAAKRLAASVSLKKSSGRELVSESITFALSDLPDFKDKAGQPRNLAATMNLQKEISLVLGLPLKAAFNFGPIESIGRSVHVICDLVTIKVDVSFRK